jgi:hypothetical protein
LSELATQKTDVDIADRVIKKVYDREALPEQVQADLEAIKEMDAATNSKRGLCCTLAWLGVGGIFLAMLTGYMAMATGPLLIWLIVMVVLAVIIHENDLIDARYLIAAEVLQVLSRDLKADTPVHMNLVMDPVEKKAKFTRVVGWNHYYRDRWLTVSGVMADDTSFTVSITEVLAIKKARKTKRKPKGQLISLLLRFSRKECGSMAGIADDLGRKLKLPEGYGLKSAKAKGNRMSVVIRVPGTFSTSGPVYMVGQAKVIKQITDGVTAVLLGAFQVLNFARVVTKVSACREGGV